MEQQQNVEVECKFRIPDGFEETLQRHGALLVSDKTFTDIYLDTCDNVLALSDVWLRKRDEELQLKYPPSDRVQSSVQQYKESEDEVVIRDYVSDIIGRVSGADKSNISASNVIKGLEGYAVITTRRKEFKLGDTVIVDLDTTNFGYNVGEIEVMTSQATSDLSSAVDTVNTTIKLLGVQTVSKFGGKLMTYLSQNNPQLFHKIKQGLHGK